ncbi:minichromosome maintenance protein 5, partial [Spiromyces aspiralis]
MQSTYISKLVTVSGIVIGASTLASKATHVHIVCRGCRHVKVIPVASGFSGVQLPRTCDAERQPQAEKCPLDPYEIVPDKCRYVDQQTLKLQEAPDFIPVGELPRHIVMSADSTAASGDTDVDTLRFRDLTNKVFPGARVTVTGIFTVYQNKSVKGGGAVAIRAPYLRVVGIQVDKTGNSGAKRAFTPEEEQEFITMSRMPSFYQTFTNSIAPTIFGNT